MEWWSETADHWFEGGLKLEFNFALSRIVRLNFRFVKFNLQWLCLLPPTPWLQCTSVSALSHVWTPQRPVEMEHEWHHGSVWTLMPWLYKQNPSVVFTTYCFRIACCLSECTMSTWYIVTDLIHMFIGMYAFPTLMGSLVPIMCPYTELIFFFSLNWST